jgi:hypothetical protein
MEREDGKRRVPMTRMPRLASLLWAFKPLSSPPPLALMRLSPCTQSGAASAASRIALSPPSCTPWATREMACRSAADASRPRPILL